MHGLSVMPKHQPLMLLANHQNALMDALLIAAYSDNAPYFLTRSDLFKNAIVRVLFNLLRMLPIYRLRDGRNNISKNKEVFDNCTRLLYLNETVLIFPEANHNLKRMVRPLSKGFTRILFNTLAKYPDLDIALVPIGVNYTNASGFPDSAAFYFGTPMQLSKLYNSQELRIATMQIRTEVSSALKLLTTHIGEEHQYDEVIAYLDRLQLDYLDPEYCNVLINKLPDESIKKQDASNENLMYRLWDFTFELMNLPLLLIWRIVLKKKIRELEFVSTFRFLYSCVFYPVYYAVLLFFLAGVFSTISAFFAVTLLFTFNIIYVKHR